MSTTGRIVRFDDLRGYGFIAPDGGGDDVFLHANDLNFDKSFARRGARVQFEVEEGERGKFATSVCLGSGTDTAISPTHDIGDADAGYEEYFDSITGDEFRSVVTEALLAIVPALSGEQILRVRDGLRALADRYGWVDVS